MSFRRVVLFISISLLVMLVSSSTGLSAQASRLADTGQPEIIEQPERPIYEPLYFETHRMTSEVQAAPNWNNPEANYLYTSATVQSLDEHASNKYNYEIYYFGNGFNLNLTNRQDADDIYPKLTRGCTHIVFVSDRTGNLELFSMTTDGANLTQLTWDSESDVHPDWSPDGTWIVWESYRDGQAEIYLQMYNAQYLTRLTQDASFDGMPAWSPDGTKIAFVSNRTGGYRIYTMNPDGSGLTQLSDTPYSIYPVWSPNSEQIAFSADADGDGWMELWKMNADGSEEQLVYAATEENTDILANAWAPSEPIIAYTHVSYFYYYGNWYWEYASIDGWDYAYNYAGGIYGGTSNRVWYMDWQGTENVAPVSAIISPTVNPQPYRFLVEWTGYDNYSGVQQYEVQSRIDTGGTWEDWILQPGYYETNAWFQGSAGHTYYFRSRAYDWAGNVEAWPADFEIAVKVESAAPVTAVQPLPRYTNHEHVSVSYDGYDPGDSGVQYFNIEKWDDLSATWSLWFTSTYYLFTDFYGDPGHTYRFRSWGVDFAGNAETPPFLGDTTTTFYTYMAAGRVTDNTGVPVEGAQVESNQVPFIVQHSDPDGNYHAYFSQTPGEQTLVLTKSEYAPLPPATFMANEELKVDFVLPPPDNIVPDWGFEQLEPSPDWSAGGIYTPTLASELAHTGQQAALLGVTPTDIAPADGDSWIAQSLTLPVTITRPVLSFFYLTQNISSEIGIVGEVMLNSEGVTSTLLTISENVADWQHAWVDLFAWSGQAVTITFRLNQALGEPLASLQLDEVTIGQARPDTWLTASGGRFGLPGEQISVFLKYGNRGVVPAEGSLLTLTLPGGLSFVSADPAPSLVDGDQVVWELGDLAAGYADGQIALILEVDGTGETGNWVTTQAALSSQTDELELLNNLVELETFVGSLVVLPFTAK